MKTKPVYKWLTITTLIWMLPASALAAQSKTAFDKFKELAGTWVSEGQTPMTITWRVASAGSAVVEDAQGMITVVTMDGDSLRVTHYCEAGNQPTMLNPDLSYSASRLHFALDRVGNLKPGAGFMSDVVYEWLPDGRLKEIWSWEENGVTTKYEFILKRK